MDQQRLYDQHAEAHAVHDPRLTPSPRNTHIAALVRDAMLERRRPDPAVLELGFGDGGLAFALASELTSASYVGLDIAEARVVRANAVAGSAGLSPRISFRALDFDRQLDELPASSADVVIAIDVLEHVFDVFGFVGAVARLTRRGGIVVLRVPNVAYIRHRLTLARGHLPVTSSWFGPANDLKAWRSAWGWDGGHLHLFTLATLRELLAGAGLRATEWRDPGARFESVRRRLPSLLAGNLCVVAERT